MRTVGAFEAKTHFSALLDQVEKGEQLLITKHGHPVAKLIPVMAVNRMQIKQAIQKLKAFATSNTLQGLDWKELRDEGKR